MISSSLSSNRVQQNAQRIEPPLVLFVAAAIFTGLVSVTSIYVTSASAHIRQAQTIIDPYISEKARLEFASRAARLSSRDDYIKLNDELREIAKQNNVTIPDF
jgi:hypothetical protein